MFSFQKLRTNSTVYVSKMQNLILDFKLPYYFKYNVFNEFKILLWLLDEFYDYSHSPVL